MTGPAGRVRAKRPHAITANDDLLGLMLTELENIGDTLTAVLDRLPAAAPAGDPAEVSEPAPAGPSTPDGPLEVTEPAPAKPAKKSTTKPAKES